MGLASIGLALVLTAATGQAPLDGYNVGLFKPGVGRSAAPTWQTFFDAAVINCGVPAEMPAPPVPGVPLVAVVAQGFYVGWASEVNPATEYCNTPLVLPPTPGDYEVSVQRVITTTSGTVYGAWTVAIPRLHLQLEPVVPCGVSGWYDWSPWSPWAPVATGRGEERTRTRTRDITNPPSGGGGACPALTETERQTRGVPDPATLQFEKLDYETQGSWKGVYGTQGTVIVGLNLEPPLVAKVVAVNAQNYTWAYSTVDPRALQHPGETDDRIAAVWYSPTSFSVDVNFTDTDRHRVAFYMLDFDYRSRKQIVIVTDSEGVTLGPAQPIVGYGPGVWATYLVSGHVVFTFMNDDFAPENNAVVNGVFLDAPSTVPLACAVSDWTVGLWGPWVPVDTITEARSRTDTREILTPPSGGGTPCPELTEVITESRPIATVNLVSTTMTQCLVSLTAPPPHDTEPGWIANWYVDSALFAMDPTLPYSGLIQVSIGQHAFQVRWTRPVSRSWWRRLFRSVTRAAGPVVVYEPVPLVCR